MMFSMAMRYDPVAEERSELGLLPLPMPAETEWLL